MIVRVSAAAILAILALAVADARRTPERQFTARVAIAGVHAYRRTLGPLLPKIGISCRFVPTCSRYAEASIAKYGIARGSWRSIKRIARCNPMTPVGTRDDP